MPMVISLKHSDVESLVVSSLQSILLERGMSTNEPLNGAICLIGPQQVLDSLGLVSLLIDVEQRLEEEHGISLSLTNDRAMSQKRSPFRTVQTLTAYICELAEEGAS